MMTDAEVRQVLDVLSGEVALIRAAKGLSLRALAAETGVSYATLSRIERGKTPDGPTLIRLARWLTTQAKRRAAARGEG